FLGELRAFCLRLRSKIGGSFSGVGRGLGCLLSYPGSVYDVADVVCGAPCGFGYAFADPILSIDSRYFFASGVKCRRGRVGAFSKRIRRALCALVQSIADVEFVVQFLRGSLSPAPKLIQFASHFNLSPFRCRARSPTTAL